MTSTVYKDWPRKCLLVFFFQSLRSQQSLAVSLLLSSSVQLDHNQSVLLNQSLITLREESLFSDERRVGETVNGVDGDDPGCSGESLDEVVVLRHLAVLHMDCLHLQPLTQHSITWSSSQQGNGFSRRRSWSWRLRQRMSEAAVRVLVRCAGGVLWSAGEGEVAKIGSWRKFSVGITRFVFHFVLPVHLVRRGGVTGVQKRFRAKKRASRRSDAERRRGRGVRGGGGGWLHDGSQRATGSLLGWRPGSSLHLPARPAENNFEYYLHTNPVIPFIFQIVPPTSSAVSWP